MGRIRRSILILTPNMNIGDLKCAITNVAVVLIKIFIVWIFSTVLILKRMNPNHLVKCFSHLDKNHKYYSLFVVCNFSVARKFTELRVLAVNFWWPLEKVGQPISLE